MAKAYPKKGTAQKKKGVKVEVDKRPKPAKKSTKRKKR